LRPQLSPRFVALIRVNEFFHDLSDWERLEPTQPEAVADDASGGPADVELPDTDCERESCVEIRDATTREAVTVIELLSQNTKYPGPHREQYVARRPRLLRSDIHLVELDLLRGGCRLPANAAPGAAYCALVSRWQRRPRAEVWPMRLREPLPMLPIPLS